MIITISSFWLINLFRRIFRFTKISVECGCCAVANRARTSLFSVINKFFKFVRYVDALSPAGSGWIIIRVGSLSNSSTASGSSDPGGTVGPSYSLAVGTYFFILAVFLSRFTLLFAPSSSVSMSYFILAVSICKCYGKYSYTSYIFPICRHTEWNLLSSLSENGDIRSGSTVLLPRGDDRPELLYRQSELFFSCPLLFFAYSLLSSHIPFLFLWTISFLLFPCGSVWENTLA